MKQHLFIAGPSGSGKTTVGNILEAEYGWTHVDCEQLHRTETDWIANPIRFIPDKPRLVFTWGFLPEFYPTVEKIIEAYNPITIWLRATRTQLADALRARGESEAFIQNPERALTAESLVIYPQDMVVDAYDEDGERRDVAGFLNGLFTLADTQPDSWEYPSMGSL